MVRWFLALAVVGGLLLAADATLGLVSAPVDGPPAAGRVVRRLVSPLAGAAVAGAHATVLAYFAATGRWAEATARAAGLPDWYVAQAIRNRRRVVPFVAGGTLVAAASAALGAAGASYNAWHLGAAATALSFNLGSFAVEYAAISGHLRLLTEIEDRARRPRAGRLEPEPEPEPERAGG